MDLSALRKPINAAMARATRTTMKKPFTGVDIDSKVCLKDGEPSRLLIVDRCEMKNQGRVAPAIKQAPMKVALSGTEKDGFKLNEMK